VCAVLLGSCTSFNKKTIDEPPVTDSIEQVIPYVPTVYDVLEERKDWKYQNFIDSVYLQMPEQILTHMLVTKGTTISPQEVVEDYLANKQFYHDTILKTMNIQKQYIPDSLPNKDKPNKPLNKSDTVNNIIN
jgi:hypothetical protein